MQISTMIYYRGDEVIIRAYSSIRPNGLSRVITRAEFLQMNPQEIWDVKQELTEQLNNLQTKGSIDSEVV